MPTYAPPPPPPRGPRRTPLIAAAAVGLVLLVGATAGTVVVLGSSSSDGTAAAAAPSASPSPVPTSAAPTPSPSPSSTVTGAVRSGGIHTGDLRYFLLTPPKDAEIYGDEDGSELSRSEVAGGSASVKTALTTYGFKAGATRTYLTADGDTEVTVDLARFSGPADAAAFYSRFYFSGTRITLVGSHPAKAYRLSSSSAGSTGSVVVVSHQGDVHLTITVTGAKTPDRAQLRALLDRQYRRLKTGR
ncbi:hypothetical protein ACFXJ5_09880 [Streptomyces sp. NPDC059373]